MEIKIDKEKCIGCGTCVALCPNTFRMNDEGKVELCDEIKDDEETIKMGIESCPTQAITLE